MDSKEKRKQAKLRWHNKNAVVEQQLGGKWSKAFIFGEKWDSVRVCIPPRYIDALMCFSGTGGRFTCRYLLVTANRWYYSWCSLGYCAIDRICGHDKVDNCEDN
jgi:hypothetical protein